MDILRNELNSFYSSQKLGMENLDSSEIERCKELVTALVSVNNACAVITNAANDSCYLYAGNFANLLGLTEDKHLYMELDSGDEDVIYERLHPEDLVEKRMLEYEFFKFIDQLPAMEKTDYKATCRIRIKSSDGAYKFVANSTQILKPSANGKVWLILCCYDLSPDQTNGIGINPCIVNNHNGEIINLSLAEKRQQVLTEREKEILLLIKEGKPSKHIAEILKISINTVNRHRQNIIEKLSVGSSVEAIAAATAMRLL